MASKKMNLYRDIFLCAVLCVTASVVGAEKNIQGEELRKPEVALAVSRFVAAQDVARKVPEETPQPNRFLRALMRLCCPPQGEDEEDRDVASDASTLATAAAIVVVSQPNQGNSAGALLNKNFPQMGVRSCSNARVAGENLRKNVVQPVLPDALPLNNDNKLRLGITSATHQDSGLGFKDDHCVSGAICKPRNYIAPKVLKKDVWCASELLRWYINANIEKESSGKKVLAIYWQTIAPDSEERKKQGQSPMRTRSVRIPKGTPWERVEDLARAQIQSTSDYDHKNLIGLIRQACRWNHRLSQKLSPFGI